MTEQKGGLATALAKLQAKMPHVGKDNTAQIKSDKGTYSYKYADLTEITSTLLPLLSELGLAWTTCPTLNDGGQFVLRYALTHTSGESVGGDYPLGNATATPQVMGSGITYARRYALCAVTGLAPGGEDDDAQVAQRGAEQARQRQDAQATEPAYQVVPDVAKAVKRVSAVKDIDELERLQGIADGYFESDAWSESDMQKFNTAADGVRFRLDSSL